MVTQKFLEKIENLSTEELLTHDGHGYTKEERILLDTYTKVTFWGIINPADLYEEYQHKTIITMTTGAYAAVEVE